MMMTTNLSYPQMVPIVDGALVPIQHEGQQYLGGLEVFWVGVRCDAEVAAARELARGDPVIGMAVSQAMVVHEGVR